MCDGSPIRNCEPTTSCLQHNVYHMYLPLYIMDMVRVFQDHPKYVRGIKKDDILEMLIKEPFACGDLEAQVKTALLDLTTKGFVRYVNNGYRTLGPIAKLANARSIRHFNVAWERIAELQKVGCPPPDSYNHRNSSC